MSMKPKSTAKAEDKKKDEGPSLFKPNKLPFDIAVINPTGIIGYVQHQL